MKEVFPRNEGQGYNIPKHHGMTKMQYYICLFGSGINFFGGPGESHHKWFVKYPGENTQRRVGEFAKQVANRIYEIMVMDVAKSVIDEQAEAEYKCVCSGQSPSNILNGNSSHSTENDDCNRVTHHLRGAYTLVVTSVNENNEESSLKWNSHNKAKKNAGGFKLSKEFLNIVYQEIRERDIPLPISLRGYTEMHMKDDAQDNIFRAHPQYRGLPWYDWG